MSHCSSTHIRETQSNVTNAVCFFHENHARRASDSTIPTACMWCWCKHIYLYIYNIYEYITSIKAKEWAKRNFGRKLKPQTLSEFDRRVQQIFAPPKPTQTQHSDRPQRILSRAIPVNIVNVQPVPTDQPSTNVNRLPTSTPGTSGTNNAYSQAAKSPLQSPEQVMKDILMIGTSNFSRISWVSRDDAQILCYPDLKLHSLFQLFKFFKHGSGSPNPGRKPRKVVISCGLYEAASILDVDLILRITSGNQH